jgi:hypothetical protein
MEVDEDENTDSDSSSNSSRGDESTGSDEYDMSGLTSSSSDEDGSSASEYSETEVVPKRIRTKKINLWTRYQVRVRLKLSGKTVRRFTHVRKHGPTVWRRPIVKKTTQDHNYDRRVSTRGKISITEEVDALLDTTRKLPPSKRRAKTELEKEKRKEMQLKRKATQLEAEEEEKLATVEKLLSSEGSKKKAKLRRINKAQSRRMAFQIHGPRFKYDSVMEEGAKAPTVRYSLPSRLVHQDWLSQTVGAAPVPVVVPAVSPVCDQCGGTSRYLTRTDQHSCSLACSQQLLVATVS